MRFADLVESLDLPQTQVAERAWADGRRRLRRRGLATAGAAGVVVAGLVGVLALTWGHPGARPAPMPAPTTSTPSVGAPVVQRLVTGGGWRQLIYDFPLDNDAADPESDGITPLTSDPIQHAALAMMDPSEITWPLVLGDEDHRWRRIRDPQLLPVRHSPGYFSPVVRPNSLSPDATRLAVPQPDALVVVDLTDGSHRTYDVPGEYNTFVTWADTDHVLVVQGGARNGVLVNLRDGSLEQSPYGPTTAFIGDTTMTWGSDALHTSLRWGDGRVVPTLANNAGGLFPQPPLVRGDVVVGTMCVCSSDLGLPFETWGIVAVDGSSGKILAYLPVTHSKGTSSLLLGWDGDNPVIALSFPHNGAFLYVYSWDWRRGELHPVIRTSTWISWGTGQVR